MELLTRYVAFYFSTTKKWTNDQKGSEVVHHAVHTHDLSHAPHTHEDTLELVHTGASEDLHSRSIDHMNELEARSKTGKKSHKGKHHGKKHHKKGGKKHHKHGKHGKHHKKHAKMQAQA